MQIGADHLDVKIDTVVDAMVKLFAVITGRTPIFRVSPTAYQTGLVNNVFYKAIHRLTDKSSLYACGQF